jgi:rare lipoprotein A
VTLPRSGGYYLDDGPGANPPADLDGIPDAVPRTEPLRPANARPYVAMGVSYRPMAAIEPYKSRGLATWYGRRYHGKPTASGEPYDMYAMTGAHTTLPIPSYARVTNLKTGRSVVIRINDRGPFVDGRLIDVSYTAAHKLGILAGATMVEVEAIVPAGGTDGLVAQTTSRPPAPPPAAAIAPPPPVVEKPLPSTAAVPQENVAVAPPVIDAPASAAPQTPVTTEGGRVFLQLGAFASRENADGFLARIKSQADWLPAQIVVRDGLHRVQAGPYASQAEARDSAERVVQAIGIKPIVQTR